MKIKYYGVRGSIPTPGRDTVRYGGNTPCVAVWCGEQLLILDAGTGVRVLGDELMQTPMAEGKGEASFLFSHTHWDHIHGFPFFKPAYQKGNRFKLYGVHQINKGLEMTMHHQQEYQNFPILLSQMPSRITFIALGEEEVRQIDSIRISTGRLNHPGGAYGYRIDYEGRSLVYASDTEHYRSVDLRLLALARDADVMIYDSMYTPEEYATHMGWGHSTYQEGIRLGKEAGVRSLHLFHHDPYHTDDMLEAILAEARKDFSECHLAREGWEFRL